MSIFSIGKARAFFAHSRRALGADEYGTRNGQKGPTGLKRKDSVGFCENSAYCLSACPRIFSGSRS
jgi:hypothetical protein